MLSERLKKILAVSLAMSMIFSGSLSSMVMADNVVSDNDIVVDEAKSVSQDDQIIDDEETSGGDVSDSGVYDSETNDESDSADDAAKVSDNTADISENTAADETLSDNSVSENNEVTLSVDEAVSEDAVDTLGEYPGSWYLLDSGIHCRFNSADYTATVAVSDTWTDLSQVPTTVECPNDHKNYAVTGIGYFNASGNDNLSGTITIPSHIVTIENCAFQNCTGITSLVFGKNGGGTCALKNIDEGAFMGCTNMACEVSIPDSVVKVGFDAFYDCKKITKVVLPSSVTTIGRNAFYGCDALTYIDVATEVGSTFLGQGDVVKANPTADDYGSVFEVRGEKGFKKYPTTLKTDNPRFTFASYNGYRLFHYVNPNPGFDLKVDGFGFPNLPQAFTFGSTWNDTDSNGVAANKYPEEVYKQIYKPADAVVAYNHRGASTGACYGMSVTAAMGYMDKLETYGAEKYSGGKDEYIAFPASYGMYDTLALGAPYGNINYLGDPGNYVFYGRISDIGQYQVWQQSAESKAMTRYGTDEYVKYKKGDYWGQYYTVDKARNISMLTDFDTKVRSGEALITTINWKDGSWYGHTMVTDSVRGVTASPTRSGFKRVYFYDPNHPYYYDHNGDMGLESMFYDDAENIYMEYDLSTGEWCFNNAALNSGQTPIAIGYTTSGYKYIGSFYYELCSDMPLPDSKSATVRGLGNKIEVGVELVKQTTDEIFSVISGQGVELFRYKNGVVEVCDSSITIENTTSAVSYMGGGTDTYKISLLIPKGSYTYKSTGGIVTLGCDDDIASVKCPENFTFKNNGDAQIKVDSTTSTKADLLVENITDADSNFAACRTELDIANGKGAEISMENQNVKINAKVDQEVEVELTDPSGSLDIDNVTLASNSQWSTGNVRERIRKGNSSVVITPGYKSAKNFVAVGKKINLQFVGGNPSSYKSSNTKIATVTNSGQVKGKKAGKVTITATCNGKKYKCIVQVCKKPTLTATSPIKVGKSVKFKIKNGGGTTVWTSSNPAVATVDAKGKVKGISKGSATIYAENCGIKLKKKVKVK